MGGIGWFGRRGGFRFARGCFGAYDRLMEIGNYKSIIVFVLIIGI